MAKYLVTSGSTFRPFSYDELAKPLQQMAEAHNASQDAYDQISLETNALKNYITDNPEDAQAKAMYDSYINKLQTLQNNLWQNGYTAQTRRDLSVARAGYASDVTRLAKAVKDRQERSAAYWKTKHDHPDMIMGTDPGTSGLDNYLNNDQYGLNYYAYSGDQFANEVGADAKARVKELVSDPQIMNDPRLAGYITRITREGFTSQEVDAASNAVRAALRGDGSVLTNLDPASQILANVLLSHLDSTGAYGQVSSDEFDRLVEYGVSGLSRSVGDTKIEDLTDKVWENEQDWNLWKRKQDYQNAAKAPTSSNGSGDATTLPKGHGYTIQDISTFLKSNNQKEAGKVIDEYFEEPFKEPIITSTGAVIGTPMDAERILNDFGRQDIMNRFGGIDPLRPTLGTGKMISGQNGSVDVRIVQKPVGTTSVSYGVVDRRKTITDNDGNIIPAGITYDYTVQTKDSDGKWTISEPLTEEFNERYDAFQDKIDSWKEQNPDIKLEKLAISKKERQKIAKKTGVPEEVPLEYVPAILATQSDVRRSTPATIAGATDDMESTRQNYQSQIIAAYNRAASSQKRIDDSDEIAIHKIKNGVVSKDSEPIDKVFKKNDVIKEIIVYPEDLAKNQIRISVGNKDSAGESSVYAVNPALLGNTVDVQMQKMKGDVANAMLPLSDPSKAVMMSPDEEALWAVTVNDYIGDILPVIGEDENGNQYVITPRDIVMSEKLQELLRKAVTISMNEILASARDNMNLDNMRVRGNTSDKAQGYNQ